MAVSKVSATTSVFPGRLTEQRKNRKLSQKQAAKDLGISQALLSHYENGVRECGLSFVVKAANYYGVSCDYLLGNSSSTIKVESSKNIEDIPEDAELSSETIVRAALSIAGKIIKDDVLLEYLLKIYSLATYFVVYGAVQRGVLPKTWLGGDGLNLKRVTYLVSTIPELTRNLGEGTGKPRKEKHVSNIPLSVSTITTWTNDYLNISIANLL